MNTLKTRIQALDPAQRGKLRALLSGAAPARTLQGATGPRRVPRQDSPLSLPQQRLWLMSQFDSSSTAYHIPGAFLLSGRFDEPVFAAALHQVAARHEILRTRFEVGADGAPRQRIEPAAAPAYRYGEARLAGPQATAEELDGLARSVVMEPLDLQQGPAWRAVVWRTGADQHLLVLSFHHIVFDGWSLGVFSRELFEAYARLLRREPAPQAQPALQYSDYVAWQADSFDAAARARETTFWQQTLGGHPPPLELPADRPRPATQSFAGALVKRVLPRSLLDRVKQFAASQACTPFGVFLAAYQTLLHRYTGLCDLTVGTPVSGRAVPEIEPLVGVFVNTLPLRVTLDAGTPFRTVLQRVQAASLDAFAHATLPFDQIVEALNPERTPGVHPVFQTLFTYQNAIAPADAGACRHATWTWTPAAPSSTCRWMCSRAATARPACSSTAPTCSTAPASSAWPGTSRPCWPLPSRHPNKPSANCACCRTTNWPRPAPAWPSRAAPCRRMTSWPCSSSAWRWPRRPPPCAGRAAAAAAIAISTGRPTALPTACRPAA